MGIFWSLEFDFPESPLHPRSPRFGSWAGSHTTLARQEANLELVAHTDTLEENDSKQGFKTEFLIGLG